LVADITYIRAERKALYLFLITDAYSRKIVGYHLASTLHHDGAVAALKMALKHVPSPKGLVHHSDRGVQYCCHDFLDEIRCFELRSSMTDGDHCAQNALAECMNGILKIEFFLDITFPNFAVAKKAVDAAIFAYNHLRIHGKLHGMTPAEVHNGTHPAFDAWAAGLIASRVGTPPEALYV
jgi:putative transposase